jgi:hypothetical protein
VIHCDAAEPGKGGSTRRQAGRLALAGPPLRMQSKTLELQSGEAATQRRLLNKL